MQTSAPASAPVASPASADAAADHRVAIVARAGDEAAKAAMAFLKELGFEAIGGGAGATPSPEALEKLRPVRFAILMRSDRPLETGFLLGVVGAARTCLLLPSSSTAAGLDGLARIPVDNGGVWKLLLARQMKQAGLDIDLNKAL
jgi:hypothetical protein